MRVFRFGLRLWIACTSALSFVAGWILLAHAPKPVQAAPAVTNVTSSALPTLAPLPSLNFGSNNSGQVLQSPQIIIQAPPPAVSMPLFRTGGS